MELRPHRLLWVVSSMEASLGFYTRALGFRVLSDACRRGRCYDEITEIKEVRIRVVFLQSGEESFLLELVEYLHPPGSRKEWLMKEVGASRFCFSVASITEAERKLKADGVKFRGPILLEKEGLSVARLLLLRDPDGYEIELRESLTKETSGTRRGN